MKELIRLLLRIVFTPLRLLGVTPPEKVFRHLHRKGPFTVKLPGGVTVSLQSWGNRVENELYWRGWRGHEPEVMARWVQFVAEQGDILDIGANTGTFAFVAKAISPSSKVVALEPLKRIGDLIEENRQVSGLDVILKRAAIADETGELPIHDPGGANAYSASLDVNFLAGDKDTYLVPVTTVDNLCEDFELSPRLIKMDVEGVEGRALMGAANLLARGECKIICEWAGSQDEHQKAISLLKQCDYVAVDLTTLEPVDLGETRGHRERNVLLIPKKQLQSLRPA